MAEMRCRSGEGSGRHGWHGSVYVVYGRGLGKSSMGHFGRHESRFIYDSFTIHSGFIWRAPGARREDLRGANRHIAQTVQKAGRATCAPIHNGRNRDTLVGPGKMSFSKSSKNMRMNAGYPPHGATLVADCHDTRGLACRSHLDLNTCVANVDGKLEWRKDGAFGLSARNIAVGSNGVLTARCERMDGTEVLSCLDLNERIANNDGKLVDNVTQ
jgi:hypothetical protein